MKIKFIFSILFLCGSLYFSAQSRESAKIRFFRTNKFLCSTTEFDIQMSGRTIYSIKPRFEQIGTFEYYMFSQGLINIKVTNWDHSWNASTVLNVENGKTYYIKVDCSMGGIHLSNTPSMSDDEWRSISSSNYESLSEDPNSPLISVPENYNKPAEIMDVKKVVSIDSSPEKKYSYTPYADVDSDIPELVSKKENRFALIIGNEDYTHFQPDLKSASNVDYARNDASAFKDYCAKIMGVPERNISFLMDATYGQIEQALNKMNLITKNTSGNAEIIFYYAGHGMPDEENKEPYLIPVDISGTNVGAGIKLKEVYSKLTEFSSARVLMFLDACFTGGARGEALAASRGVSVKPKEQALKGNTVVFNSSSGSQSSLGYPDKHHGMFTYFLLKKLKESKGNISLSELAKYVSEKVSLETVIVNNKEQNPQTTVSPEVAEQWGSWKLNE